MGQRHAPAAFYPRERPGIHFTGGRLGRRAGLDRCGKSFLHRDSIPGPSAQVNVFSRYKKNNLGVSPRKKGSVTPTELAVIRTY
jgi:hypothetical protein